MDDLFNDLKRRMTASLEVFQKDLGGLRTGRASPAMLDHVMVDAYGVLTPIAQVGSLNVPEPRMLTVQLWDAGLVKAAEKAIREAELGVNPVVDGVVIRLPLPDLTQERRKELAKLAHKYAEATRVAVRSIRRDGMDALKKAEKDMPLSQEEARRWSSKIQELTDEFVSKVDKLLESKEKDILHV